jgi:selenocysteine lyase/cysteine desulfurase
MDVIQKEEQSLTRIALLGLQKIPGLKVYGVKDPDSARFMNRGGIIAFSMKGIFSDKIARKLMECGIGVRYGCHCAHILVKHLLGLSPSLERFQQLIVTLFPSLNLPGVARVSFGIGNSEGEVDTLIRELKIIANKTPSQKNKAKLMNHKIDQFVGEAVRRVYS